MDWSSIPNAVDLLRLPQEQLALPKLFLSQLAFRDIIYRRSDYITISILPFGIR